MLAALELAQHCAGIGGILWLAEAFSFEGNDRIRAEDDCVFIARKIPRRCLRFRGGEAFGQLFGRLIGNWRLVHFHWMNLKLNSCRLENLRAARRGGGKNEFHGAIDEVACGR